MAASLILYAAVASGYYVFTGDFASNEQEVSIPMRIKGFRTYRHEPCGHVVVVQSEYLLAGCGRRVRMIRVRRWGQRIDEESQCVQLFVAVTFGPIAAVDPVLIW